MSAVSVVLGSLAQMTRQRERTVARLGNQLAIYVRDRRMAVSAFLIHGEKLEFALPAAPRHEQLSQQKGVLHVGTYKVRDLDLAEWNDLSAQMLADVAAAIAEYHEGLATKGEF